MKSLFSPEEGILLMIQYLPFFLPSLSHFPLSLSLSLSFSRSLFLSFFSFSLSLSLSPSLLLFSCFLPSLFSFLFPSLFFVFLSWLVSLLLYHAKNKIKFVHLKVVSINMFCFLGFLFCFVFQIPFSYLYFFLWPQLTQPFLLWCLVFLLLFLFFVLVLCLLFLFCSCLFCCWSVLGVLGVCCFFCCCCCCCC